MESQPRRSVAVDRIEWSQIFQFPALGRMLPLSLSPARLMQGFAIYAILMFAGSLWDAVTPATVGPGGLGTEALTVEEQATRLEALAPGLPPEVRSAAHEVLNREPFVLNDLRDAILTSYFELPEEERTESAHEAVRAQLAMIEEARPRGTFTATMEAASEWISAAFAQFLGMEPVSAAETLVESDWRIAGALWEHHPVFLLTFGVIAFLIWVIGAGMLARSAACEFAVEQSIPWTQALAFALKRWLPLAGTYALPLAAVIAGTLLLALGGLLFHVPVLNVVGAILYGPALLGGFLAVCIIVLMYFSSPLFVPAVAVEATDAPDAISRSFSYVKNRPIHFLLYLVAAFLIGGAGLLLVSVLAVGTINFTAYGASLTGVETVAEYAGGATLLQPYPQTPIVEDGWTDRLAVGVVRFWLLLVTSMIPAYLISYTVCASTVVYFLLRRATDGQEFDEIWQPGLIEATMAPQRGTATGP